MSRRIRRPSDEASYLKYLRPGALAKLRDSRISARSHSKHQISFHRTVSPASSPVQTPIAVQMSSDGVPCFAGRISGPRFPQRKKLVASQAFYLQPASPVMDLPNPIIDMFSNDFLVAH